MSSVALLFRTVKTTVTGTGLSALELDATLSESPSLDADVTEHPVEEGFNVADGIRNKPIVLSLQGLVSNTPILNALQATQAGGYRKGSPGRADEAFALLQQLRDAQDVVTVATRLKSYTSMAITSIKVTRDPKTGDALDFTLSLKQVRVVSSKFVSYPKEPRGAKKVPGGEKATKDAGAKSTSVLKKTSDAVGKFFGLRR